MTSSLDVQNLTKNQNLVMKALTDAKSQLSAYAILDALRPQGFRAPPQVYRALDQLIELGLVHKLESMNAFIACQYDDCLKNKAVAFTICDACEQVSELSDKGLTNGITDLAAKGDFEVSRSTVELHGTCDNCKLEANSS